MQSRPRKPIRFVFLLDSALGQAYSLPHDSIRPKSSGRQSCRNPVWWRYGADEMKLKVGDKVSAVIKSTEVMLEKD
jgi:hypothetical protein